MIQLPITGTWKVAHGKDYLADIVNTRNMDFDRPGYAMLGKKAVVLQTETDDSDFGTVLAIVPISTGTATTYHVVTSENLFTWDATISGLSEVTGGSPPTFGLDSDAVAYLGLLTASGGTTVRSYLAGTWTSRATGRTATNPHPLCVFEDRNTLCQADGNTVYQTTAGTWSDDSTNRLIIPSEYIITGMRSRRNLLFIATRSISGAPARLFIWNGSGPKAQYAYDAGCSWIYSLAEFASSIVILTSTGQLLRFNGGGFDELANFPVYYTPYSWESDSSLGNVSGKAANRGMIAHGGVLLINIDGSLNVGQLDTVSPYLSEQPSGLWCFDPEVGLYHRAGYNFSRRRSASYTLGSSNFVFATAHLLHTGDPVYVNGVTGLTGLVSGQTYFAIVDSSTSIRLAYSAADALAGRHITVTGSPSGNTLIIDTFDSVGATFTQTRPGAVGLYVTDNPPALLGSTVMFAGDVTTDDGQTSVSSFMSLGTSHNVGSFTTTPLPASQHTDTFSKLVEHVHGLELPDAKVVVKWKGIPRHGFPTHYRKVSPDGLATWTDASTFTIDTTAKEFMGVEVGDEVEIIEGAGAGYTAHVSAIDDTTSTYAITLDEAIPGITAGDKSEVIADSFKKLATLTSDSEHVVKQVASVNGPDASLPYISYKLELRGLPGLAIRKLTSISAGSMMVK